jgi:Ca-activated chloride channel family protein
MDERQLKDIMGRAETPPADDAARERAIGLAMAAYDEETQESGKRQNRSQGFGLWRRLTGRTNPRGGRRPMVRQFSFAGMATATAVVIGIGIYGALDGYPGLKWDAPVEVASRLADEAAAPKQERVAAEKAMPAEREQTESDVALVTTPPAAPPAARPKPAPPLASTLEHRAKPRVSGGGGIRALQKRDSVAQPLSAAQGYRGRAAEQGRVRPPMPEPMPKQFEAQGRDHFADVDQNTIKRVADTPVSTFSIDVDTASYAFVRRMLNRGVLPQKNAVRIEELINYFDYDYPQAATADQPFQPTVTVTDSPWKAGNKLVHIGIKGYDIEPAEKPRSNLVFLLDVSGSMRAPDKLPLMVSSLKLLLGTLGPDDTVAIVVYAGAAGTVLEPTKVAEKQKILAALDRLQAGGSTAGAAGIRQAYALAESNLDAKAVNRVILATDGDFNVGITNREEFKGFVERKRKSGVFLSVLGFGQGNLNDHLMQTLAQNGNGVAAHIDTLNEARKVLVEEASSTLFPIAKDVKIQVEFNPRTVAEYRLIGYETRALRREDFNNDKVDAGDIGAGHTVTAIYEITPVGGDRAIGASRYGSAEKAASTGDASAHANEYGFVKIRYKLPDAETSRLTTTPISVNGDAASAPLRREARWATAVAAFGQILKGGKYTGTMSYDDVISLAQGARGQDAFGYRAEFVNLVRLARSASALPPR